MIANARIEAKPYPSYKRSGVSWTGDVPEHWEIRRLGDSAERCINGTWGEEPDGVNDLACIRVADFDRKQWKVGLEKLTMRAVTPQERPRRLLKPGDLLLEKSGGGDNQLVGVVVLYDHDFNAVTSNFVGKLEVRDGYHPKYLTYLHATLYALEINKRSIKQTTGIQNIDAYAYLSESVAYPPFEEQDAIVRYLDDVDQRIRAYVSAKERLIALLEEMKQAVIQQAVTQGLDPNVKLKPSGVEWLGNVPEHWDVVQLGRIGSFSKGSGGTKDDEVPNGIPCIRYGDLYTTHKYFVDQTRSFIPEEKLDQYTSVKKGDVLFPTTGETIEEIGKSAVNLMDTPVYCGGDLIIFRPSVPMDPKFSGYLLDTPISQDQKSRMGRGVSIMHIYSNQLKYLWLSLPTIEEQKAIAEHLDRTTANIQAGMDHARRQVKLMEEYRTRLIADAVTGKIDLRSA